MKMSVDDEWLKGQMHYAPISASSSGDTTLVAAQGGRRYRVVQFYMTTDAPVFVKFKSGSTDVTGPVRLADDGKGHDKGLNPAGWFITAPGEALKINLSGNAIVGGVLGYREE
jgi:hypothetical protein